MKIERRRSGNVAIVEIHGMIKVGESAHQFTRYLDGVLKERSPAVLIDLTHINYVDSTGLGELVGYLQRFTRQGRSLALANPHQRVRALLKLTKLDDIFSIYDSVDDAIKELDK